MNDAAIAILLAILGGGLVSALVALYGERRKALADDRKIIVDTVRREDSYIFKIIEHQGNQIEELSKRISECERDRNELRVELEQLRRVVDVVRSEGEDSGRG